MTIQLVEKSIKKGMNGVLEFKLKNLVDSGKVNISPRVFVDGRDVSSFSTIQLTKGKPEKVRDGMDIDILYGQEIIVRISSNKPLEAGDHTVKVLINVNWPLWTELSKEFTFKT